MPVHEMTPEEFLGGKNVVMSANVFPGLAKHLQKKSKADSKSKKKSAKPKG